MTGARGMALVAVAVVAVALDQLGWRWPLERFDAWANGRGDA